MLVPCGKHLIQWEEILCVQHHELVLSAITLSKYVIHLKEGVKIDVLEEELKEMLVHVNDIIKAGH